MALTALRDAEVAGHVAAAVLLSPIAFLGNLRSQFCHAAAEMFLDKTVAAWGLREFNLNKYETKQITSFPSPLFSVSS